MTAKRIRAGLYEYRGATIEHVDHDRWVRWDITYPGERGPDDWSATLKLAKEAVDAYVDGEYR